MPDGRTGKCCRWHLVLYNTRTNNQLFTTMYKIITTMLFLLAMVTTNASAREKRNFNGGWLLKRGDITAASAKKYDDTQ